MADADYVSDSPMRRSAVHGLLTGCFAERRRGCWYAPQTPTYDAYDVPTLILRIRIYNDGEHGCINMGKALTIWT